MTGSFQDFPQGRRPPHPQQEPEITFNLPTAGGHCGIMVPMQRVFHLLRLLLLPWVVSSSPSHAEIEVTFLPATKPEKVITPKATPPKVAPTEKPAPAPKPEEIDGVAAYYLGRYGKPLKSGSFDELKEGMTLREIVTLFGPGSQEPWTGLKRIGWWCRNGKGLYVEPPFKWDAKAEYYVVQSGVDQRHDEVALLAKSLIASIKVTGSKAEIALTHDTYEAKAHEVRTYEAGQTFQKTEPLPQLDLRISKIEGDAVHCRYSYQAEPKGLLRYSETGTLILREGKSK
ncbi:hypothetical protein OKA04_12010 [Luteolibacter flavescens]|uniref:Uncharacterized protein n=1 Tax=Luteolibacter flavescens TaxID=1859460 RepID=A0ABT3FQE8_9BACT|nr:hypothetical protein [Luteolibacter flavescens]MCW1885456.1 hypothetical protein [Luteolibacter flavescens]